MLYKTNDEDQGGGGNGVSASIRDRAIELLENRRYREAIELLTAPGNVAPGQDPPVREHDLLGIAHFMLEDYAAAAAEFDEASARAASAPAKAHWEQRARLARANHAAGIAETNPPTTEFDAGECLAPPSITNNDLPPPPGAAPRSLRRSLYGFVGKAVGGGLDALWKGVGPIAKARHHAQQSLWTTWDAQPLWLGLLTLASMREHLAENNLKDPYPEGELIAFQKPVPAPAATSHFRAPDGSFNDLANPREGSANVRFPRNVADGAAFPAPDAALDDPSVTQISEELLARPGGEMTEVPFLNLLAAAWIQFMVHDWVSHRTYSPDEQAHVVGVAKGLPAREAYHQKDLRIGKTMPDPTRRSADTSRPPTTINEVTSWWDGSQLYGSDAATTASVRSHVDGKLKLDGEFLPTVAGVEVTGYNRNWWVGLSLLHTLFAKEHNAICDRLREGNPLWDDERLFNTARLVNAAVMAKLHTVEWTPAILPNPTLKAALETNWYGLIESRLHRKRRKVLRRVKIRNAVFGGLVGNPAEKYGVPYGLSEEFVEVYRLHELLPDSLRLSRLGHQKEAETVTLAETRGKSAPKLVRQFGVANLLASFGVQSPGQITLHNYPQSLREVAVPGAAAFDVAAADILRARERGVPRYNEFRRQLGLTPIRNFADLTDNDADVEALRRIYGDVERLDMQVGTRAEQTRPKGFGFGETLFQIFILNASRRLQADRFFTDAYNAETYTQAGLDWVDDATFKSVLLRHYPELGESGLANVENAFEPWDSPEGLTEERHPLRYADQPWLVHRVAEDAAESVRNAVDKVKTAARNVAAGVDQAQTRVRAVLAGASFYDPLPPGSFGLPLLGESLEFIKGSGPFLEKRFRKYGPIFKTHIAFKPTVCLGGNDGYPFFLSEEYFSRKDGAPLNVQWLFNKESLSFKDGPEQQTIRERLLAAFDDDALDTYLPALNDLVSLSIKRWEKMGELEWVPELASFSYGAIDTAFMGAPPDIERGFFTGLFELLTNGVVRSFFSPELYVALGVRELFEQRVNRVIAQKRNSPGPDVVSRLLAGGDGGRLDEEQLRIELVHFFLAGAPLESALAYHLMLLGQNPAVMERASNEVLAVKAKGDLTLKDVRSLEYVLAACRESRRAARLVPNTFFAKVKKPFEFDRYRVPAEWKATGLIVPTQHDGAVFKYPDRYDPSRFGQDRPPAFYVAHGGATDPHRCIGERFTDMVMTLLTARLLQGHTWELVPAQDLGPRFGKVAPVPNGGLKVIFHSRRERPG